MRDASFACIREVGVETGGSNIQFAVDPETGRMVVIEMNPRVSRSSALASKATGFPIAKIAAKLAVGYSLDELRNDITRETSACFEPTIDYVVTKIPRFTFEKFPETDPRLTSAMKSVGEVMAIGRTFKESLQKALRSLEVGARGLGGGGKFDANPHTDPQSLRKVLAVPNSERIFGLRHAFLSDMTLEEVFKHSKIDRWFLHQVQEIVEMEKVLAGAKLEKLSNHLLRAAKEYGFSDTQIAHFTGASRLEVRKERIKRGIHTVYRLVDTCAAEFEAYTPYYYSTYGDENERADSSDKKKVMIIGGGPNRIGQGIEFDYCCVHASFALREAGFETIMVNSNPETVSTDYDTSDRLYFEPLTAEDVLEIYHQENCWGAIVQLGGQTPLNLATELKKNGVNIIGTSPEMIDSAEDRKLFQQILNDCGLKQPVNATVMTPEESYVEAGRIGFPLLLRPSFVLGGRGMFIVYSMDDMKRVVQQAFDAHPGKPVLLDKYLEDAFEVDVDCVSDGETTVIGGILEHIEFAGVHSGDAGMVLPPHTLQKPMLDEIRVATQKLAQALEVKGLMNVQFAIKDNELYVLEVNPRASRTVPFVSKAIHQPLAKIAARVMAGEKLVDIGFTKEIVPPYYAVKESVFPFVRFPGAPVQLSPEMRSTGEVMGLDLDLGMAFAKSQMAVQPALPTSGKVFLSVKDKDKEKAVALGRELYELGLHLCATEGTALGLQEAGIPVQQLNKISDDVRPNILDLVKNGEISMIINTPDGASPRADDIKIRREAVNHRICIMTTLTGAAAAAAGIRALKNQPVEVRALQDYKRLLEGEI